MASFIGTQPGTSIVGELSSDTTPQLGGSLDVNGQDIVSVSNGNILLTPNGSGVVRIDGTNGIDIESDLLESKIAVLFQISNCTVSQVMLIMFVAVARSQ